MGKTTKEKIKSPNLPVKREFSGGGAVYLKTKSQVKWYLIKPTGFDRWQLPKGHLDGKESSQEAAVREVEEETGVVAKVITKLGVNKYFYVLKGQKIFKTVTFFLMEQIKKNAPRDDGEVAAIKCVTYDTAVKLLTYKDDREIITQGNMFLRSNTPKV